MPRPRALPGLGLALSLCLPPWAGTVRAPAAMWYQLAKDLHGTKWLRESRAPSGSWSCVIKSSLSQNGEDMMLLPLVLQAAAESGRGTFVEIGANDGLYMSNTYVFERCFNFTGLLIEANPANFRALQRNAKDLMLRPGVSLVHKGVCPTNGTMRVTAAGGVTSGSPGDMSSAFLKKFAARNGKALVDVPCDSLGSLMDSAGLATATLLSLDVEGAEAKVLQTVNPARFSVLIIESDGTDPPKEQRVDQLCRAAGLVPVNQWKVANSKLYVQRHLRR